MSARSLVITLAVTLASMVALAVTPAAGVAGSGHARFNSYASCAHRAPYRAASRCRWRSGNFQAAFLFRSHVGRRMVRGCYRTSGPRPFGGHHGCVSFGRLSRKVYPLKLPAQVHGSYTVSLVWLVADHGPFRRVAASRLKILG
jgi:hypothetical protein